MHKIVLIFILAAFCVVYSHAQEVDSLAFESVVSTIMQNNAILKQQDEKTNTAMLKEQLVKSAYKPNIYTSAAISRSFPIPAFDIAFPDPVTGEMSSRHFQMYPDISMDYSLKINQLVYDFGRTGKTLALQQSFTDISRFGTDQLKDRLIVNAAGWFYNLIYVQEAVQIKNDLIVTLKQHLSVIQKKQATGSATQYEILSTQVRISAAETQLADLETARQVLISHLNYLMGTANHPVFVKQGIAISKPEELTDSVYSSAGLNRPEMIIARENVHAAEWGVKVAKSGASPTISLFGSTGYKNGYLSDINGLKFNYVAGLNLNVPLFDSQRRKVNTEIAGSSLADSKLAAENTENQIRDEVTEIYTSLQSAYGKIEQYSLQVQLAAEAYDHAQANYAAGTITNLDLLDSSNAVAESALSLLKAKADFKFFEVKFRTVTGKSE